MIKTGISQETIKTGIVGKFGLKNLAKRLQEQTPGISTHFIPTTAKEISSQKTWDNIINHKINKVI